MADRQRVGKIAKTMIRKAPNESPDSRFFYNLPSIFGTPKTLTPDDEQHLPVFPFS